MAQASHDDASINQIRSRGERRRQRSECGKAGRREWAGRLPQIRFVTRRAVAGERDRAERHVCLGWLVAELALPLELLPHLLHVQMVVEPPQAAAGLHAGLDERELGMPRERRETPIAFRSTR